MELLKSLLGRPLASDEESEQHVGAAAARRWLPYLLHNQRAQVLTALLTLDGDERIVVVNMPWHMKTESSYEVDSHLQGIVKRE